MIEYQIKHHIPGRIRIEIPGARRFSRQKLRRIAEIAANKISLPDGVKDVQVHPLSLNLIFEYDPTKIDIIAYLNHMAKSRELQEVIEST